MESFEKTKNVGIVGAKLLYKDNTIQHAGVIIFPNNPTHPKILFNKFVTPSPAAIDKNGNTANKITKIIVLLIFFKLI